MNTKKPKNSYDETKRMLNTIRKFQASTKPKYGLIGEQLSQLNPEDTKSQNQLDPERSQGADVKNFGDPVEWQRKEREERNIGGDEVDIPQPQPNFKEEGSQSNDSDYAVINDVEVVIHSEDPEDLELTDEEKGKVSQLIDDFRDEVVETAEFDKLDVYETSAKFSGKIGEIGMMFTLSTGDDTGLYINGQMLKIEENTLIILEKLVAYQLKFSSTINDLLVRRRTT